MVKKVKKYGEHEVQCYLLKFQILVNDEIQKHQILTILYFLPVIFPHQNKLIIRLELVQTEYTNMFILKR